MREERIINEFQRLNGIVEALGNYIRLNLSGAALYDEALKNLLQKKGIITETELTAQIGEEIKKVNSQPTPEAAKPAEEAPLVTPTPAEVAKVEQTKQD